MKERILVVDDDVDQCELLTQLVASLDYTAVATTSAEEAIERLGNEAFDAVLTDLEMTPVSGVELCARVAGARAEIPVVLVTGVGTLESAVAAMRAGAYDFLSKPVELSALGLVLRRALERRRLTAEVKLLREAGSVASSVDSMIGESPAIRRVKELVQRVGATDVSVLVEGETGTGKELVARAIHRASARRDGPFVAINCAAVPATLLESELFGHIKGAYTDAKASRDGLFVQASGGTLFLDEIGEMPMEMQAKLLRALQERVVRPVGGNREVPFDTRIVAATHRNIEEEIAKRTFREDLYYRINVVKIAVPPLRERGNDVLLLATHALRKASERSTREVVGFSPQVASAFLAYLWPGNVRELENCIERAVALTRFTELGIDDVPDKLKADSPKRLALAADDDQEILALDDLEKRYILRALKILRGNRSRAATLLGLDRRTLYRRLEKYEAEGATLPPRPVGFHDPLEEARAS